MNPILKMRQGLAPRRGAETGTVIAIDGDVLRVRTLRGVVTATGNGAFRVGADVLVRDGVVQGRVKPEASVTVYYV